MNLQPLGVIPREVVVVNRMNDIKEAIQRYIDADLEIPQDWVTEYFELEEWLRNYRKEVKK